MLVCACQMPSYVLRAGLNRSQGPRCDHLQVYCYYDGSREVAPGYRRSKFDEMPFGVHMDVSALMAKQMRIGRQDDPTIAAASFDAVAVNAFQEYVQAALSFSVQRCGVLYGRIEGGQPSTTDEDGEETEAEPPTVFVDVVYEPPQEGKEEWVDAEWKCREVRTTLSAR